MAKIDNLNSIAYPLIQQLNEQLNEMCVWNKDNLPLEYLRNEYSFSYDFLIQNSHNLFPMLQNATELLIREMKDEINKRKLTVCSIRFEGDKYPLYQQTNYPHVTIGLQARGYSKKTLYNKQLQDVLNEQNEDFVYED